MVYIDSNDSSSSSGVPAWWIVAIVLSLTSFIAFVILVLIRRKRMIDNVHRDLNAMHTNPYRQAALDKTRRNIETDTTGAYPSAGEHPMQLQEWRTGLNAGASKRRSEEENNDNGTRVWFSRSLRGGKLDYWLLSVDGIKFQLTRDSTTNQYQHTIDYNFKIEQERRRAMFEERVVPSVDETYVCLLGWTQCDANELEQISIEVQAGIQAGAMQTWSPEQCHRFLQRFTERVIATQAIDWTWFDENVKSEYQEERALPSVPLELVQRHMDILQAMQRENDAAFGPGSHEGDAPHWKNLDTYKQLIEKETPQTTRSPIEPQEVHHYHYSGYYGPRFGRPGYGVGRVGYGVGYVGYGYNNPGYHMV